MAGSVWRLVLATAVGTFACLATAVGSQSQSSSLSIPAALDLYARGEFQRALDGRPFDGHDVVSTIAALDGWVGPAGDAGRAQTAARFALDVIAQRELTRAEFGVRIGDGQPLPDTFRLPVSSASPRFVDQRFTAPIVAWACAQVPHEGPLEPWESWWWMTSIALLQEAGEWGVIQGNQRVRYGGDPPPAWRLAVRKEVEKGHLAEARRRLGPLPRIRLAEAVTHSASLTDATRRFTLGSSAGMPRVEGRYDVLRHLEAGARSVNSGLFAGLQREFEALLSEPGFEGEVSLRIAQLRLMRRDWDEAREWLDRAARTTDDRIHLAAVDYFRGWIFERTDQPVEALAAYRAANARYAMSPNLNTLLAAQLMQAGERAEAARVVEATIGLQFDHHWRDLWILLVEGDARRAPRYAQRMREAR
jgi:hypothetical protein